MVEQEKYNQQFAAQLIKIEKDIRKSNEILLALVISNLELNRLTLKTLQVQFNVMDIKPTEMDAQIEKLMSYVKSYSEKTKEISNTLMLSAPSGE